MGEASLFPAVAGADGRVVLGPLSLVPREPVRAGQVKVAKMNVDENPSTPSKYGIRAIPTLILFKGGEVIEQITGAVSKSSIKEMISQKAL